MSSALLINKDSLIDYKKIEVMHFNQLKRSPFVYFVTPITG